MVKILFFIFISSNLIYHVIILDYEFQKSKCNVLEMFFLLRQYANEDFFFFFFGLECFIIMLFVFFLNLLKVMVYNLNFNLLACACVLFKLFKNRKILGK